MPPTTPPRPLDIEAEFPDLAGYRGTSTRLHPRPGTPGPDQSSVGGPFLWPDGEPWPVCTEPHPRDRGRRIEDVHEERRVSAAAWSRGDGGPTEEERAVLAGLEREHRIPGLGDTDPVPLLPVAQLFARDVPGLVVPEGRDLLQVLWCPFGAHDGQAAPGVHLRWRTAAACVPFPDPPRPAVVGDEGYVPEPCVLDPERVTEHQWAELLPEELRLRIAEWEEALWEEADENGDDGDDALSYDADFAVAPGWKAGGFARWGVTGPQELVCSCGSPMRLLLAVGSAEWEGVRGSWRPLEEAASAGADETAARTPTRVVVGRGGSLLVFVCSADPAHEHRVSLQ
ncbi:hypothetical protein [Streptomyces sp. NPDC101237]|uniref:hypothetical protein n=1 Tax=Streptomyces sp. NPDC101237 TaxID=3366139 RepID=UPI0037F26065